VIRRALVVVLAFAAFACNRAGAPVPAAPKKADAQPARHVDLDRDNLLNLALGAAVVSRTAESDLESSALHAIDGMANTGWSSPIGDANQTLIYSFGAPVRIDRLGFQGPGASGGLPEAVRFSASADGVNWREVLVAKAKETEAPQVSSVDPFEANFLRVEPKHATAKQVHIASLQAFGQEIYPPTPRRFDGCWMINGQQALLVQRGARITGAISGDPVTVIDGGTDGRVLRLMWMRGPMWGYAAAALSFDGRALSALTFHQNPYTGYVGRAWLGERCDAKAEISGATPVDFLNRTQHWTMSGLAFDDREQIIETLSRDTLQTLANLLATAPAAHRFRIVAHEFRHEADENRQRSVARIDSLRGVLQAAGVDLTRVEFVASGDEDAEARQETVFAVQRLLWSRVDLVLQ
jgi:hypothetical protein